MCVLPDDGDAGGVIRRGGPVAAVLAAILVVSLIPSPPGGGALPLAAAGHLLGYAALAATLALALDGRYALPLAFAVAVLVGAGVEVIQPEVGRTASLTDAALNAVGAALGLAVIRLARRP